MTPSIVIVLLSGGLDSTTCLALAIAAGHEVVALSFDYQQRHRRELDAAKRVGQHYGVASHLLCSVPLFREIGGSEIGDSIPVTYVPSRNLLFLSHAMAVSEVVGATSIWVGVNAIDSSGYPDCRPEFVDAFERTANLATKSGVKGRRVAIHTPLITWTKAEIVSFGRALGVPHHLTHSCSVPPPIADACGRCESCRLRRDGFHQAGIVDPIRYAAA